MRCASVILIWLTWVSVSWANAPTGKYKEIVDGMHRLAQDYPQTAHVHSIGTNDDGVELYSLRVSVTPSTSDPEKIGHLVVGTHHGNETHAPLMVMEFAELLLARYHSEAIWREDLADQEYEIVPVLNVSGYNAGQRQEHGIDPNRDYPGPCHTGGGQLKSVRTLMAFMNSRVFTGTVTVHGYVGTLTYPWGIYLSQYKTLDHDLYHQIVSKAAEHNDYRVGTSSDIVYPVNGAYEDYVYWKHGMWSILVELLDGSDSDIATTAEAVYTFFAQLAASPSNQNTLNATCVRSNGTDFRRLLEERHQHGGN